MGSPDHIKFLYILNIIKQIATPNSTIPVSFTEEYIPNYKHIETVSK